jgi:hypothetical protein
VLAQFSVSKVLDDLNNLVCIADIRTRYSYIRVPVKR